MLSSRQITDMIKAPHTGVNVGRATFAARQARTGPRSHQQFAEDMANLPTPHTASVAHPEDAVRGAARNTKALAPADLAWLDRLPRDPSAVPFTDATALAGMAQGIATAQPAGASDRRLIDAVWQPVKAHHDRRVADAAMANARQPLPPIPPSALPALSDAVAAEVPQLRDDEVLARAQDLLRTALEERGAARQQAIRDAEDQLMRIAAADHARTVVEG